MKKDEFSNKYFSRVQKVGFVQIICNCLLTLVKFLGGFLGKSNALISDGLNSLLDISTSSVGYFSSKASSKKADENHQFGHEKVESLTCLILSFIMIFISIVFIYFEVIGIINKDYIENKPNILALSIAIVALIVKFSLMVLTFIYYKKTKSELLKTQCFDHASDSIGTILSLIALSLILGFKDNETFYILDPIVSIIISSMIIIIAIKIAVDNAGLLLDKSAPLKKEEEFKTLISSINGVSHIDALRSRIFGARILLEVEITVAKDMPLIEAHNISEEVRNKILENFSEVKHVIVHVNPDDHEDEISL